MTRANIVVKHILPLRGNTTQSTGYTGLVGEVTVDTDLDTLRVHDGTTAGGKRLATYDELEAVATGGLDLSGYATTSALASTNANVTAANAAIASLRANIGAFHTYANATFTGGGGSTYSNTNVAAYLVANPQSGTYSNTNVRAFIGANLGAYQTWANATFGTSSYGDSNVAIYLAANPQSGTYSNTNVQAYLGANVGAFHTWANATFSTVANAGAAHSEINALRSNITAANATIASNYSVFLANASAAHNEIDGLRANIIAANTAITTANTGMKSYVDAVTTAWTANAGTQATDINALRANITAANSAITTANTGMKSYVDSVTTSWVSNAATQAESIAALQTQTYSNVNVSAYLAGDVTVGNLTTNGFLTTDLQIADNYIQLRSGAANDEINIAPSGAAGAAFLQLPNDTTADQFDTRLHNDLGNVEIGANAHSWTFGNDGTLALPSGGIINYANGVSILDGIGGTFSNTNVAAYLVENPQSGTYSDANVAALLDNGINITNGPINFTASPPAYSTPGISWPNGFQSRYFGNTEVASYLSENNYLTTGDLSGYATTSSLELLDANVGAYETWANTEIGTKAPLASPTFTGTVTATGNIAAQGNVTVTRNMTVLGNLSVQGTTTTVNATTLTITDKFITVANGSLSNEEANGAGMYVPGSSANILYTSTDDAWTFNKTISGTGNIKAAGWVLGATFAYANSVNILSDLYSNAATQATSINTFNANLGAYQTYANANAATQATGINTLDANVGAYQTYANANAATQATSINTFNANLGAYQTFANANAATQATSITTLTTNAATQQTSINTINANLGAYQTYANATFSVSSYGNANVAGYLPVYSGNIQAANITTLGAYGNITGANVISANTFVFGANGSNILGAVSALNRNGYAVTLGTDGVLTTAGTIKVTELNNISAGQTIMIDPDNMDLTYIKVNGFQDGGERVEISNQLFNSDGIYFYTENAHTFRMYQTQFIFPDSTSQTTAWTGTVANLYNNGQSIQLNSGGELIIVNTIRTAPSQWGLLQSDTSLEMSWANSVQNPSTDVSAGYFADATGVSFGTYRTDGTGTWIPKLVSMDFAGNLSLPGNFLPTTDNTQDLGSATMRFRHLYVGPGTVYVGNAAIKTTATGNLILPGLTRAVASSAYAEEVEDTDDQTHVFTANPTIIDNARYELLTGGQVSSFTPATYLSTGLDGDGYIRNINIVTPGSGYSDDVAALAEQSMWATQTANPLSSFNINNWIQIPFRVRSRAGESEFEFSTGGGGSSSLEGLDDVQLDGPAEGQVLTWNNSQEKWENRDPSGGGLGDKITLKNNNYALDFGTSGSNNLGAPNNTDYKGERIVLWDNSGAYDNEWHYAIGMQDNHMWFGIDEYNDSGWGFKWYGQNHEILNLDSAGTITLGSTSTGIFWSNGAAYSTGGSGSGGVVERNVNFPYGETGDTTGTLALTPGDEKLYICIADYEAVQAVEYDQEPASEDYDKAQSINGTDMVFTLAIGEDPTLDTLMQSLTLPSTNWQIVGNATDGYVRDCVADQRDAGHWTFTWQYVSGQDNTSFSQGDVFALVYAAQPAIWQQIDTKPTTVGNTAPSGTEGALWYNTDDGRTYVYALDTWIDANPTVAPAPEFYLGNNLEITDIEESGNKLVILADANGDQPSIDGTEIAYIPTVVLEANDWIGNGTNDPATYATVTFANGETRPVSGWNTDSFVNSGFLSLDSAITISGADAWPITVTAYDYVHPQAVVNFGNNTLTVDHTGNLLVNGNLVTGSGSSGGTVDLSNIQGNVVVNQENSGFVVDAGDDRRVGFMKYFGFEGSFVHANGAAKSIPFRIGRVHADDITLANIDVFTTEMYIGTNGKFRFGDDTANTINDPVYQVQVVGNIYASSDIITASALQSSNGTPEATTAILTHGIDSNFQLVAQNGVSNQTGGEVARFGLKYNTPQAGWNTFTQYLRGASAQDGHQVLWAGNTAMLQVNADSIEVAGEIRGIGTNVTITADTTDYTFYSNGTVKTDSALTILVPGVPNGVANWNGQGGWNQGSYNNLATTGGTGSGLTVDVAAGGGGYINISAISIHTPGTGYTDGDVITINNENNLPGSFTITVPAHNWIFGTNANLVLPAGGTIKNSDGSTYGGGSSYGNADVLSLLGEFAQGEAVYGFDTTGVLSLPNSFQVGSAGGDGLIVSTNAVTVRAHNDVYIDTLDGDYTWTFGLDGHTTFPDHMPVTITGNLTVGNLIVNGNTTTVNTQSYTVSDNIVQFAADNPADTLDIGFVGHRTVNSTLQHTGLVRDASSGLWKLFSNVSAQPGTTVDFSTAIFDDLQLDKLYADTIHLTGTAPSTAVGTEGDLAGDIHVDTNYLYYCTTDWSPSAWTVPYGGASGNTLFLTIGGYPDPQVGWIVNNDYGSWTIATVSNNGYGSWEITWVGSPYGQAGGGYATLTNPNPTAIWKTIPISAFGTPAFSNTNVAAYLTSQTITSANIGAYQTYANTQIQTLNANIGAFHTYANATFGTSSYSNTQVAAYLLAWPSANIASLHTTSGNITTLSAVNFSSGNIRVSGGYISALTNATITSATLTLATLTTAVATNFSTANAVISGGYISALTNATVTSATLTSSILTTAVATNFSTANAVITGGYASGLANIAVATGGNISGVGNIVGSSANTTITAGAYTSSFLSNGMVAIGGNLTVSGNNNNVVTKASFIGATGTATTLDNISANWSGGPAQFQIATVSGSILAHWNIQTSFNGTFTVSSNNGTLTTSPTNAGGTAATAGDAITVLLTDITNGHFYRITGHIGPSYLNSPVIIERVV